MPRLVIDTHCSTRHALDALYALRSCWSLETDVRLQFSCVQLESYRGSWQPLYALYTLGACGTCSALQSSVRSVLFMDAMRHIQWLQTVLGCPEKRYQLVNLTTTQKMYSTVAPCTPCTPWTPCSPCIPWIPCGPVLPVAPGGP